MATLNEVAHYDISISEPCSNLPPIDSFKIIEKIRPNWNVNDVRFEFFNNGLTNKVISFWTNEDDSKKDRILFRIYGAKTELIIDRNYLSPPLYCTFDNGIVYGFVPGQVINSKSVRDITIARLIARKLAKFHSINISQYIENETLDFHIPVVFRLVKRFLAAWKDRFGDSSNNDIGFIDFEYAGPNFQSFDIANHFAEFAGTDDVDYSLYPDETFRKWWIEEYLVEFNELNSLPPPNKCDVDELNKQVQESLMIWYNQAQRIYSFEKYA